MAINSPRIAGQPSVERNKILEQPVAIRSVNPGETYAYRDPETGILEQFATYGPEFEGQIYFNVVASGSNRLALMYVAVDLNGALAWKSVVTSTTISGFTGEAFDPMYD